MTRPGVRFGAATHPGRVRDSNEDTFLAEAGLFIVADGMGGHQAGEVASELAVTTLKEGRLEMADTEGVASVVRRANDAIIDRARTDPATRGMGTTITGLVMVDGESITALAVNVGDSRTYRWREGSLEQITVDHSYVQDLVASGMITPSEARTHPRRNIVTRALGVEPEVRPDVSPVELRLGDRFVICSDGLVDELTDDEITTILLDASDTDPDEVAHCLVTAAVDHGGRDNVTIVILDIVEPSIDDESSPHDAAALPDDDTEDATGAIGSSPGDEIDPSLDDADSDEDLVVDADDETSTETTTAVATSDEGHSPISTTRRRIRRGLIAVAVTAILVGIAVGSMAWYARSGYFVDVDDNEVVVFQGRDTAIWWFEPTRERTTGVRVDDMNLADLERIAQRPRFDSIDDAVAFVAGLPSVTDR
jgi:serine/threonine protein phosphatase PrpC